MLICLKKRLFTAILVVFDKNEIKAIPLSETAGKLKFVLPTKVGEVMQTTDVSKDEIFAAFDYITK